jgi:hypothetical protein
MLDKRQTINFLYTLSFPVYGIGSYVAANINGPIGHIVSVTVHMMIVLFYVIDILYKKQFDFRINGLFFLMIAFQLSCISSFVIALAKNPPFIDEIISYARSGIILLPFYAFIAVCIYNLDDPQKLVRMTFNSLSILLFLNLVGFYVFGLKNGIHSIEGRLSLPFIDGMYSGACMIAIINLMSFYYMKEAITKMDFARFWYLFAYFILNLLLLFFINSRMANLIFLFVFLLAAFNVIHRFKGLFLIGVFFVPLLLNLGYLLYEILSLPFFKVIMQRVNVKDVTTFNGRSFAWQKAIDWLLNDQTNVVFGNGHNGHYFLHLMTNIAKVWGVKETDTHLHSTSLSILVDQGLVGAFILLFLCLGAYTFFRKQKSLSKHMGILFAVMVFVFFVMQVDMFVYRECMGSVLLSLLIAIAAIKWKDGIKTTTSKAHSIVSPMPREKVLG